MQNANKILFRASQNGYIMPTEKATKEFTDTQIDKLVEIYNYAVFNRYEEIQSKYLDKGNEREEDSITLVSVVTGKLYTKNEERLNNEFVTCIVDLFDGPSLKRAEETIDIKSSWSKNTFDKARVKKINPIYKWQGVTQMWLTGAKKHTIAYCLVNGTQKAIDDEKRKISWGYGPDPETHPEYIAKCKHIEINHIFNLEQFMEEYPHYQLVNDPATWSYDIPFRQRVHTITFDRNEGDIIALSNRIKKCREWMNVNLFKIA